MIEQSYPIPYSMLKTCIEAYHDGRTGKWIGSTVADLAAQSLDKKVLKSPRGLIQQLCGAVTIPTDFFIVHAKTPEKIAAAAAAGARVLRLRDTGTSWAETCAKYAAVTNVAGTTNRILWANSSVDPAKHVFMYFQTSSSPSGLQAGGKLYHVVNHDSDGFQLALTPGGSPVAHGTVGAEMIGILVNMAVCHPDGTSGVLDKLVAAAVAGGMKVIYDASKVPPSISQDGTMFHRLLSTYPYSGKTSSNYVTRFMEFLLRRYSGGVSHIQVGNEAQDTAQFHGSIAGAGNDLWTYANQWKSAATYWAGQGLATAKIVAPSFNVAAGVQAMKTWLTDGGKDVVDIVSAHPYWYGSGWLGFDLDLLKQYVSAWKAAAPALPFWVTECGTHSLARGLPERMHYGALALGVSAFGEYSLDTASGVYSGITPSQGLDMRISSYPEVEADYYAMLGRAGQSLTHVNRCVADGRIAVGFPGGAQIF